MNTRWLAAIVFLFTWTLTTHGKYSASGDEPHYLMITHSLVTDHDIDLANNYAADNGRLFGHGGLEMGLHALPARTGRVISIHDQGLGVFLVPIYTVARQLAARTDEALLKRFRQDRGLFTYSIVGLFLIAMTTMGMVLVAGGLTTLASADGPAVYHCAAGKDRTGVISAVILGVLGGPDEVIVADYAATKENLEAIIERLMATKSYATVLVNLPPDTLHAEAETMVAFLERIRTEYGDMRAYARDAGVAPDALEALQRLVQR